MNKQRSRFYAWGLIIFSLLLLGSLFIFKDHLTKFVSGKLPFNASDKVAEDNHNIKEEFSNIAQYDFTFLEFGAEGCVACRKMEYVMRYIDSLYRNVNVQFFNVRDKESSRYADYYGVSMIPAQIVLDKNGTEIFRHTGYIPEQELEKIFLEQ